MLVHKQLILVFLIMLTMACSPKLSSNSATTPALFIEQLNQSLQTKNKTILNSIMIDQDHLILTLTQNTKTAYQYDQSIFNLATDNKKFEQYKADLLASYNRASLFVSENTTKIHLYNATYELDSTGLVMSGYLTLKQKPNDSINFKAVKLSSIWCLRSLSR